MARRWFSMLLVVALVLGVAGLVGTTVSWGADDEEKEPAASATTGEPSDDEDAEPQYRCPKCGKVFEEAGECDNEACESAALVEFNPKEKATETTGERTGNETGEETSDRTSDETGDQTGEDTGIETGDVPEQPDTSDATE